MRNKLDNALSKQWAFGFQNRTINGVQNLTDKDRNAIFYISSHSGIIYDFENRTQTILQGHQNIIKCCVVSKDKNFIVTCDSGDDPIIVIWDSRSGVPIRTIMNAHSRGIDAVDISDDCLFIVTLGTNANQRQEISVWAWSREEPLYDGPTGYQSQTNSPMLTNEIPENADSQHTVCFDSKNKLSIVSTGSDSVIFWNWEEFNFEFYVSKVLKSEFSNLSGKYTCSLFLSGTNTAITSTTDGFVIVWEPFNERIGGAESRLDATGTRRHMKAASKVLKLVECGITVMTSTENNYLALGCTNGAIRFYDFFLRLESWFEDISGGGVTSLSFSVETNPYDEKEAGTPGLKFWVPNFTIGTADALVVGIDSNTFDELNPEDRRGFLLLQGFPCDVVDVKCHPARPLVAFTCSDPGSLQIWNYDMKLLMNLREFSVLKEKDTKGKTQVVKPSKTLKIPSRGGSSDRKNMQPTCMAFEAESGDILAVGFKNGDVKILNTETLQDIFSFCPSSDSVLFLKFSPSGMYLAGFDDGNHTLLFKRVTDDTRPVLYTYVGRIKVHSGRVAGIDFGYREGEEMLISVGGDRKVCEYDLEGSSIEAGLQVYQEHGEEKAHRRDSHLRTAGRNSNNNSNKSGTQAEKIKIPNIEVVARPTAILWHPKLNESDNEEKFVIVNTEHKFKEFNAHSKQCRKTTLAPIFSNYLDSNFQNNFNTKFSSKSALPTNSAPSSSSISASTSLSSPPNRLLPIRIDGKTTHYAYSCPSRIIGVGCFPLTGDPTQVMGINAHSGAISAISVSFDGRYLFSSGHCDQSSYMYELDLTDSQGSDNSNSNSNNINNKYSEVPGSSQISFAGPESDPSRPFLSLLEGGEGGDLHEDLIEYFYFCQLRAQGEDSMDVRTVSGHIPIEEIPSLVRAVGFYPSEAQVLDMLNEVRYQTFITTGLTEEVINLPNLIALYVNHRPVTPLNNMEISDAFSTIARSIDGEDGPVLWENLQNMLVIEGEGILARDLDSYLAALVGAEKEKIPENSFFDSVNFAEKILGFEP